MVSPGSLLALGRTSEVFAYGSGSVVKVLRAGVPQQWAELEAGFTEAVRQVGVPAPIARGLVEIDGRQAIVFERIDGASMWQTMQDQPAAASALATDLAEIQGQIQRVGVPAGIPDLTLRLCGKIEAAPQLRASDRRDALDIVAGLPRGAALLHGDLHPGNVLMGRSGPIVIDWFDAAVGHPLADIVRSSILLRPPIDGAEVSHLPGGSPEQMTAIHHRYARSFHELLLPVAPQLPTWEAAIAAGRLSEGVHGDESILNELWDRRQATGPSAVLAAALARDRDDRPELVEDR